MPSGILELRTLRCEDEAAFRAAEREFAASGSDIDFAFQYQPSLSFKTYVEMVNQWPEGQALPVEFVPNTYYVGVVAERIVGRLSLRHWLNDFLWRIGGHIGYCVVPSQRRRGYAKQMLKQSLEFARAIGIQRVLVTCDIDNPASMRVIEANGGVLKNRTSEPELRVQKYRYWINL